MLTNRDAPGDCRSVKRSLPFIYIQLVEMINFDSTPQTFDTMSRPIQIYKELRKKIVSEELKPGSRLPSRTELCKRYNVSKATVHRAYELLLSDGYIQTFVGTGAFVRGGIQKRDAVNTIIGSGLQSLSISLSEQGQNLSELDDMSPQATTFAQELHIKANQFAWTYWKRAGYSAVEELCAKGGTAVTENEKSLRSEIAQRLTETRGVVCRPRQVFILPSREAALDLVTRMHVSANGTIAYQDPAIIPIKTTMMSLGANLLELPAELTDDKLNAIADDTWQNLDMLYLTPACALPSGVSIQAKTRVDILNLAITHNKLVVEDDYLVEFSDAGLATRSLQGMGADCGAPVIYLYSFDTILSGICRAAVLVVPPELSGLYRKVVTQFGLHLSVTETIILNKLMSSGDFEKLAIRARADAQHRQSALIALIEKRVPKAVFEHPYILGASLNVAVNNPQSEAALRELCAELSATISEFGGNNVSEEPILRKKFQILYSQADLKVLLEMAVRNTPVALPDTVSAPEPQPIASQTHVYVSPAVQNAFAV